MGNVIPSDKCIVCVSVVNLAGTNTECGPPFWGGFGCKWGYWVLDLTNIMFEAKTKTPGP